MISLDAAFGRRTNGRKKGIILVDAPSLWHDDGVTEVIWIKGAMRVTKVFGPSKEGEGGEEEEEGGDDVTPVAHGRRKVENGDQKSQ